VQKVAKSPSGTCLFVEIPAPGLSKIRHWTEFDLHLPSFVKSAVHDLHGIAGVFFVEEFAVDVTDHVIAEVVTDVQFVNPSELGEFQKHVLVETKKVFKGLHFVHFRWIRGVAIAIAITTVVVVVVIVAAAVLGIGCGCSLFEFRHTHRMTIDVFYKNRWGKGGSVVETTASIRMAAGSDLEVKRTVDLVFFRSVDAGQMFRHFIIYWLCFIGFY